jgi:hypothetical protein
LKALVGTGRHVQYPQADDQYPNESDQPDQRSHLVLPIPRYYIANTKWDQKRKRENRELGYRRRVQDVAYEHEHKPRTERKRNMDDKRERLLGEFGAVIFVVPLHQRLHPRGA